MGGEKKTEDLVLRISREQKKFIKQAARIKKVKPSALVRRWIDEKRDESR